MQAIINNHFANLAKIADGKKLDADDEEHQIIWKGKFNYRKLKKAKQLSWFQMEKFYNQIHTNLIRYIAFGHNDCASEKYTNDSYVRRQMPP